MRQNSRKTIGTNPLDAVVPDLRALRGAQDANGQASHDSTSAERSDATASGKTPLQGPATVFSNPRKERLTIHLPVELIERVKNAVFWTPGLTLADLGEQALTEWLDSLEAERGAPYETRLSELKGGRPMKR